MKKILQHLTGEKIDRTPVIYRPFPESLKRMKEAERMKLFFDKFISIAPSPIEKEIRVYFLNSNS